MVPLDYEPSRPPPPHESAEYDNPWATVLLFLGTIGLVIIPSIYPEESYGIAPMMVAHAIATMTGLVALRYGRHKLWAILLLVICGGILAFFLVSMTCVSIGRLLGWVK